jgi:hypothetical protein
MIRILKIRIRNTVNTLSPVAGGDQDQSLVKEVSKQLLQDHCVSNIRHLKFIHLSACVKQEVIGDECGLRIKLKHSLLEKNGGGMRKTVI